jgi:hypothetical protein
MDEAGFFSYMRKMRRPVSKIESYTNSVRRFAKYLTEHEAGKSIEDLTIGGLKK